jgi:glycosyltransferase involved in cell wall biosynthesis
VSKKIKLLVIGDGVTPTGFARVLHSTFKHFNRKEYDIIWLAVNYYGDPTDYDYKFYPATGDGGMDLYGIQRLEYICNKEKPDVIFLLNDVWVLDAYLEAFKRVYKKKPKPKIVVYFPVDAEDHMPIWYKNFDFVDAAFTYTEFGRGVVKRAKPDLEIGIVPHGIDNSTFYKINKTKMEVRKELFKSDDAHQVWSEDLFIFLNANRNQPRKRIDLTMRAFQMFAEGKDDVRLFLHMGLYDAHVDIELLGDALGINKKIFVSSPRKGIQTVADETLNLIYNCSNVGINTSMGEGWGLINCEHAITGAPQIVGNHSALGDLYRDCGLLVEPIMKITQDHIPTTARLCRAEDFAEKMELIYTNRTLYEELSKKSIEKFTSKEYHWENIAKIFDNKIKELLNWQ